MIPVVPGDVKPEQWFGDPSGLGETPARRRGDGAWAPLARWQVIAATPALLAAWGASGANVGLRTKRFPTFDVDVDDPAIAKVIEEVIVENLEMFSRAATDVRRRAGSARVAIPTQLEGAPLRKRVLKFTLPDGREAKVELLGDGQQFVVAGTHRSGAGIEWSPAPPRAEDLPRLGAALAGMIFQELEGALTTRGCAILWRHGAGARPDAGDAAAPPNPVDAPAAPPVVVTGAALAREVAKARAALAFLDPAELEYDEKDAPSWIGVGMALRHDLGEAGLRLWDEWSQRDKSQRIGPDSNRCGGPRYQGLADLRRHWRTFRCKGAAADGRHPRCKTLRSLFKWAQAAGWVMPDDGPGAAEEFAGLSADAPKGAREQQQPAARARIHFVDADKVTRERVDWLWRGRVAFGHLTVIAGDPGVGKSITTLDFAARLSAGRPMPGEAEAREPARALVLNAEDGAGDTIRPRLEAAGADLSRVTILNLREPGARIPQLPDDVGEIERYVKERGDVKLLVIDPLNAFLPMKLDSHKDQDVRQALAPLEAMAQRLGIAVVLLVHLNKGSHETASALYRASGSIGIVAAARSVLFVGRHPPGDPERRAVAQAKPQLGPPPPALAFSVKAKDASDPDSPGVITWNGEVAVQAEDLVRRPEGERSGSVERAEAWLRDLLAEGPVSSKEVFEKGKAAEFSERTLYRAKERIRARARRTSVGSKGEGGWACELPGEEFREEPPA